MTTKQTIDRTLIAADQLDDIEGAQHETNI
jgi:hypothetical protein